MSQDAHSMDEQQIVPKVDQILDAAGNACVDLTPQIKKTISPMESGQVLEVLSDDPAAREGVPAWSRLTGHELVKIVQVDDRNTRFFIKRK
jgi:tRNA 2-thiouridine synthesizing protein A